MNISQRLRTCAKHTGLDAVIELLQEAADEIDALQARAILTQQPDNTACKSVQKRLEAQQPATGEPVVSRNPFASRCYTMSESHLSGHRLIVGFEELGDAQDAHEWVARQARGDFTHPAPSVPADVVRDAISTVREHYRGTDWGKAAESICDAIDAAMLAAK